MHEGPPRRRVSPLGSWRDRRIWGEESSLGWGSRNRGSSEGEGQGVARNWAQSGCSSSPAKWGWGVGNGLNIPGRLALTPGPLEHFRSAFKRKGSATGVKNELERIHWIGRELKCGFFYVLLLLLFSLFCYLKKWPHTQIDNRLVIICI